MKIDKFMEVISEWGNPMPASLCGKLKNIDLSQERFLTFIRVVDGNGKPLRADIRIFPLENCIYEGKIDGTDDNIGEAYRNGRMDFIRTYSNELGYATIFLKAGHYQMEASKGSCYTIMAECVYVNRNQTLVELKLNQFIKMNELGWHIGDIHHHSIFSSEMYNGTDSVFETPLEVSLSMESMGLDFGALSDHHNVLNHNYWKKVRRSSFLPILSKEISTSNGHVMALNVSEDIVYNIPKENERTDQYLRDEFIRITEEIKRLGGLPQLNHPTDPQKAISWNPEFLDIIDIFQSIEIWNGSKPFLCNSLKRAVELWLDLLEKDIYIPATTGSDTHNTLCNDYGLFYKQARGIGINIPSLFEKWAKISLGSGCVRTFVKAEYTVNGIVEGIRRGNSVLSNGPILVPTINGAIPGETAEGGDELSIYLLTNRRLKEIQLIKRGKKQTVYSLSPYEKRNKGYFDYSHSRAMKELKAMDFEVLPGDYVIVIAYDDCTNAAISNPIFMSGK